MITHQKIDSSKGCLFSLCGILLLGLVILIGVKPSFRLIFLFLVSELSEAIDAWKPLHLDMAESSTTHILTVGNHEVSLLQTDYTADDGPVKIAVSVDNESLAILRSSYNYDLFMDEPAAYYAFKDINQDGLRDLIIRLTIRNNEVYYIDGLTGKGFPSEETTYGPCCDWWYRP